MKTFKNLEQLKQDQIINSAMAVFAVHGYDKSSMSEIAKRAEVSKATLFYHFGTKLELYCYLLDTAFIEVADNIGIDKLSQERDFFECLRISTEHKMIALRKRPSLMKFITSFYFDQSADIEDFKVEYLLRADAMRQKVVFDQLDTSKFKSTVEPKLVLDMLLKWVEGYIAIIEKTTSDSTELEISAFYDKMVAEFIQIIEMFRVNFYQPQYL